MHVAIYFKEIVVRDPVALFHRVEFTGMVAKLKPVNLGQVKRYASL